MINLLPHSGHAAGNRELNNLATNQFVRATPINEMGATTMVGFSELIASIATMKAMNVAP